MKWAVILAGGSGTRFWPLSTPSHPKQLLPLTGQGSTAQAAVRRLEGLVPPERILLVTGAALAPQLGASLKIHPGNLLVEPRAASTGPALVWATAEARRRDPEAEVLSLHADWHVANAAAFRRSAALALEAARRYDRLITVGVVPDRPDTGYGYIIPGEPLGDGVRSVERFTEKPDADTARRLVTQGALWNTGLFAWTAGRLLEEVRLHAPELAPHLSMLDRGNIAGFFQGVQAVSIDVGVFERSRRIAVLPGAFPWDDVGNWEALHRVRPSNADGNVLVGPVYAAESSGCLCWSEDEPVVLDGVRDLVVVRAHGRILVMHRSRAADLKQVLDRLPPEVRNLT